MTPRPRHPIHILLACMPKSGSTFLAQILVNMPGMRRERLVPDFERREQELCPQRLREAQALTEGLHRVWRDSGEPRTRAPRGYAAQHHVRYSRATGRFIGAFGLLPVVLTRNIFDIVPSLYDHIRAKAPPVPMAYIGDDFDTLDEETALAAIADLIIPWYFNFYVSWAKADIETVRITYEDLTDDPEATVAQIYTQFGRTAHKSAIQTALARATAGETRRNQAVAGRGDALPPAVRARIEGFARYYPSVDFSPIGLP